MNILFFLTPKSEVIYIDANLSLQDAVTKIEQYSYTALPIINQQGEYVGTITEGDLFWYYRSFITEERPVDSSISIANVPRKQDYLPVRATSDMEDLVSHAMNQNYVPVVDDDDNFIGIITRRDLIQYCYNKLKSLSPEDDL